MHGFTGRRRLFGGLLALGTIAMLLIAAAASGKSSATAPTLKTEPTITGTPKVGNTLTGDRGEWNGTTPINTSAQWMRCDTNAASCSAISGETANTLALTSDDLGSTIRFRVTAKNSAGSKTADSNATGVVGSGNGEPVSTKPPIVSGFAEVGNTIHTTTGTWVGNTPITYSYQWQRCDVAGNACSAISGAHQASYKVSTTDSEHSLRVKVTAKNARGVSSAISEHSALVTGGSSGGSGPAVDVGTVPADERLVVDTVVFTPNPVTSRSEPIHVKIRVKDTRGKLVRGAYVFFRSTPVVTSTPTDAQTDSNGWVVYTVTPEADFPLKSGYSVQFYVKAYRHGDKALTGIYGSRLVQVATKS